MLGKNESFPFAEKLSILCSFTLSPPPYCKVFFKTSCLKWGLRSENISMGEEKKGEKTFSSIFREGGWSFYNPKIKIWKINYCENKIKLNNKGNSKNKPGKSFCLSTSFSFSSRFKNFLQLAFIYSNLTTKTLEQGV